MKNIVAFCGIIAAVFGTGGAFAVSAGVVSGGNTNRGTALVSNSAGNNLRGMGGIAINWQIIIWQPNWMLVLRAVNVL